jgi:hypothetical protein
MGWAGNVYSGVIPWIETETLWDQFCSRFDRQNVIEVCYEELISNPELQLSRVCDFLGVSYSPEMLRYPAHSTYEPPDPSNIQKWKGTLGPREVALVEIKAGHLLSARNYEPSGHPLNAPRLLERMLLAFQNKLYKWRFLIGRCGFYDAIMQKLTRRLLPAWHAAVVNRTNEKAKQYLK